MAKPFASGEIAAQGGFIVITYSKPHPAAITITSETNVADHQHVGGDKACPALIPIIAGDPGQGWAFAYFGGRSNYQGVKRHAMRDYKADRAVEMVGGGVGQRGFSIGLSEELRELSKITSRYFRVYCR